MPNSLRSRLNKLIYKGLLEKDDLKRIIILPIDATNGDVVKAIYPKHEIKNYKSLTGDDKIQFYSCNDHTTSLYTADWWNAPYKGRK